MNSNGKKIIYYSLRSPAMILGGDDEQVVYSSLIMPRYEMYSPASPRAGPSGGILPAVGPSRRLKREEGDDGLLRNPEVKMENSSDESLMDYKVEPQGVPAIRKRTASSVGGPPAKGRRSVDPSPPPV